MLHRCTQGPAIQLNQPECCPLVLGALCKGCAGGGTRSQKSRQKNTIAGGTKSATAFFQLLQMELLTQNYKRCRDAVLCAGLHTHCMDTAGPSDLRNANSGLQRGVSRNRPASVTGGDYPPDRKITAPHTFRPH